MPIDDKARDKIRAIKSLVLAEDDDEDEELPLTWMEKARANVSRRVWDKIDQEPEAGERGPCVTR